MRLAIALLLCACSTERELCSALAKPVCERAVTCMGLDAAGRAKCEGDVLAGCCGNRGSCERRVWGDSIEAASKCAEAAPGIDCAVLLAGKLPGVCRGVVK